VIGDKDDGAVVAASEGLAARGRWVGMCWYPLGAIESGIFERTHLFSPLSRRGGGGLGSGKWSPIKLLP